MEFIKQNYISTITSISYDTGTLTIDYILASDISFQWISDGFDDDTLKTELTFSFDETLTVSRIALREHNLKQFRLYYNGATANTFAMSTTAATTSTNFIANTDTSHYFIVDPVDCTSVTLQMDKTLVADSEKAVGQFYVSDSLLSFSRLPSHKSWKPKISQNNVLHRLSDGSTRNHKLKNRWSASIKLDNITKSFRDDLEIVYNRLDPYAFCPFGTSTAWDNQFYGCVWDGDFEFYKFAETSEDAGYVGTVRISETT